MINTRTGLLALFVSTSFACIGQPDAPASPTRPMETSAVPVERAFQDAPCAIEGQNGTVCARDGDFCPNGGYRPSRLTCRLGTWRCIVDTTRSCDDRRPSDRMCADGENRGECNLGSCWDGSPVPAQYLCLSNHWLCQPVAPGCPDPATRPADAGTPPADTTPPAPRGRVIVSCGGPEREEFSTGIHVARLRQVNITSLERPLDVRRLPATINPSDSGGHTFATDGSAYFRNARVQDMDTGETVMGPIVPTPVGSDRHNAQVEFRSTFRVGGNATRHLSIQVEIAASESWRADLTGHFYGMRLGAPSLPYVFYAEDDLRWADTGETVAPSQVTYDPNCFSELRGFQFMVRSQNASIMADIFRTTEGWSTTIMAPAQAMSLPMSFVNDGYEDGFLDAATVDGTAIVDGSYSVDLNSVASDCRLFDSEGHNLGTAGFEGSNRLVWRNISLRVPGVRNAFASVHCSYRWPTGISGAAIVVRLGVERGNLRVRSASNNGRIDSTLALQNNRVAPDAMTVTIRPAS